MFDTITEFKTPYTSDLESHKVIYTESMRQDGELIPSSVNSENWVFTVIFILFILLIIGLNRSYKWIVDASKSIIKANTRTSYFSKITIEEYQSKFLLSIFSAGVISLYIYIYLNIQVELKPSTYLLILISSLTFLIIKGLLLNFIGYVYFDQERLKSISKYFTMISIVGLLFAPLLLLRVYFYTDFNPYFFDTIVLIISISVYIFMLISAIRLFLHKMLDFFHIMLYLCTLEILPLIGMFHLYILLLKEF